MIKIKRPRLNFNYLQSEKSKPACEGGWKEKNKHRCPSQFLICPSLTNLCCHTGPHCFLITTQASSCFKDFTFAFPPAGNATFPECCMVQLIHFLTDFNNYCLHHSGIFCLSLFSKIPMSEFQIFDF